jgi:hypothetical protein
VSTTAARALSLSLLAIAATVLLVVLPALT